MLYIQILHLLPEFQHGLRKSIHSKTESYIYKRRGHKLIWGVQFQGSIDFERTFMPFMHFMNGFSLGG